MFIILFTTTLILHFMPSSALDEDTRSNFYWKSGSWGTCLSSTRCGEGHKSRKVWCQDDFGSGVAFTNCNSRTKPPTREVCFRVCEHHKFVLRWKVGPWSACTSASLGSASWKLGVAQRTVECMLSTTHLVVDGQACEYFWDKPESEMPCSLDLPQKCVTYKKNVTCSGGGQAGGATWIQEVDDILVAPEDDDDECLLNSKQPVCSDKTLTLHTDVSAAADNKIKIGAWSPCIPYESVTIADFEETRTSLRPVIGVAKRKIHCINFKGEEVDLSFCKEFKMPPLWRRCVVPVDCTVSPWSEWQIQKEGCTSSDGNIHPETRIRRRQIFQVPIGIGASPCPPLYEERIVSTDLPPCYKYEWYPLEWTDCQIFLHLQHGTVEVLKPTCGNGLHYRNLTCLRLSDKVPVNETLCKEPRPSTIEQCEIPCRRDCQVSHWARWGPCRPFNNTNLLENIKSGFQRRVRSILVNPTHGGKPCPHLEEVDSCIKIDIFDWSYGNWSDCEILDPQATCGPGKMSRAMTCVNFNGVPMNDFICRHNTPPENTTAACRVPCPNDCIFSEWSSWTECNRPCFTSKDDAMYFRNRTLLAVGGEGGRLCNKKRQQMEFCNTFSCNLHKWTATEWGSCLPLSNDVLNPTPCGSGIQRRHVHCTKGKKSAKKLKLCDYMVIPETERKCELPCPVDCVLSNFSDWTDCGTNCSSELVQYRHRLILQSPKHGGKSCPEALVEARPCSSVEEHCFYMGYLAKGNVSYHWDLGYWSDCMLPLENQSCGMGFQVRNLTCVDGSDSPVELRLCLPAVQTSLPDGPTNDFPSALRSCEVICSSNCSVSAWSPWGRCEYGYNSKRNRSRELVGSSTANVECIRKVKTVEEEFCPSISTNLTENPLDEWMSCILEPEQNGTLALVNGQVVHHVCGWGYRYKFGAQISKDKGLIPGLEEDFCWVDCPTDCLMSQWSKWSDCNVPCGQGFRERKRRILIPANLRGRPCPETKDEIEVQRDVCNIVCSDYHWSAVGWTECDLGDANATCGEGTHFRSVRCVYKPTETEAEERRCDPLNKPASSESCKVYCPGECVVSPWEVAKKCTEPCSIASRMLLTRKVLRLPNSTAEPCPTLETTKPCVPNVTCFHYEWVLGPWSNCIISEGAYCGEGVLKRPLICLRSDGRQVDPIECEKTHKSLSLTDPISKPCFIYCPLDCVVSEWSQWNENSCKLCGSGHVMRRFRTVLQTPSVTGQPCPTQMDQSKPCPFKPCYHWKLSEWSQCDLQDADCGYGVRRRMVECIRFDHLVVDRSYCLTVNASFPVNGWTDPYWLSLAQEESREEEICHVPCPGDCVMSEWSEWSHCQKRCRMGQIVGYQTSSRLVLYRNRSDSDDSCTKRIRTKPCWSDSCDLFAWKYKNNSYVCERRDGLIVQGGCTSEPRPCFDSCKKLGGSCEKSTGLCMCDTKGEKTILTPSSKPCQKTDKGPHPPANFSAPTPEIKLKYYPDDSQVSIWMYAMISIGTAFVIFVAVTVYLMCRSSLRQRTVSVERQPSVRRRINGAVDHCPLDTSPCIRSHSPMQN